MRPTPLEASAQSLAQNARPRMEALYLQHLPLLRHYQNLRLEERPRLFWPLLGSLALGLGLAGWVWFNWGKSLGLPWPWALALGALLPLGVGVLLRLPRFEQGVTASTRGVDMEFQALGLGQAVAEAAFGQASAATDPKIIFPLEWIKEAGWFPITSPRTLYKENIGSMVGYDRKLGFPVPGRFGQPPVDLFGRAGKRKFLLTYYLCPAYFETTVMGQRLIAAQIDFNYLVRKQGGGETIHRFYEKELGLAFALDLPFEIKGKTSLQKRPNYSGVGKRRRIAAKLPHGYFAWANHREEGERLLSAPVLEAFAELERAIRRLPQLRGWGQESDQVTREVFLTFFHNRAHLYLDIGRCITLNARFPLDDPRQLPEMVRVLGLVRGFWERVLGAYL